MINQDGSIKFYTNLTAAHTPLLTYVYSRSEICTNDLVKYFDLSSPNASAKLKRLQQIGLLHAERRTAKSGGIEVIYSPFIRSENITHCKINEIN